LKIYNIKYLVLFYTFFIVAMSVFSQSTPAKDTNYTAPNGLKQGYWEKYDKNNILKYKGTFKNNIPVDTFKYYDAKGFAQAVLFFSNNGKTAGAKLYYANGKIKGSGLYVNNKKNGLWKYYNEKGILIAEDFYKQDKKNGVCKIYYANGKISDEKTWKDDLKSGEWKQYYYTDGAIKLQAYCKDDFLDGQFKFYYPSGIVMTSGIYERSLKQGIWTFLNEEGKLAKKKTYEKGKLIKEEIFIKNEDKDIINIKDIKKTEENNDK